MKLTLKSYELRVMKLTLKRIAKKSAYTIGKLYIEDLYFCDTIEDTDRGLRQDIRATAS
jgi:hypothetical protein